MMVCSEGRGGGQAVHPGLTRAAKGGERDTGKAQARAVAGCKHRCVLLLSQACEAQATMPQRAHELVQPHLGTSSRLRLSPAAAGWPLLDGPGGGGVAGASRMGPRLKCRAVLSCCKDASRSR